MPSWFHIQSNFADVSTFWKWHFENDVKWRQGTSRRRHDVKFGGSVPLHHISHLWIYEVISIIGYKITVILNFADIIWECIGNFQSPVIKAPEKLIHMEYEPQTWWKHVKIKVRKSKKKRRPSACANFSEFQIFHRGGLYSPPPCKIGLRQIIKTKVLHENIKNPMC